MYQVTEYATSADCIFASEHSIRIHSIYKNTVNFSLDNLLFSFQNENSVKTPISLILSKHKVEELDFYIGEKLYVKDKKIQNDRIAIGFENAKAWDSVLPIADSDRKKLYLQKMIVEEAIEEGKKKVLGALERAQYDVLMRSIHKIHISFERKEYLKIAQISSDLIGLGVGLTPSGDDFNVGFLSVLYNNQNNLVVAEILKGLKVEIDKKKKETNDISAAFLRYACEGKFSDVLHDFYHAGGVKEKQLAVQRILKLGHSSGEDILIGINVALGLFVHCNDRR